MGLFFLLMAAHRGSLWPEAKACPLSIKDLSNSDLQLIPGIGPVMAKRLKASPEVNITAIHGVGTKLEEKWSPYLSLHNP